MITQQPEWRTTTGVDFKVKSVDDLELLWAFFCIHATNISVGRYSFERLVSYFAPIGLNDEDTTLFSTAAYVYVDHATKTNLMALMACQRFILEKKNGT